MRVCSARHSPDPAVGVVMTRGPLADVRFRLRLACPRGASPTRGFGGAKFAPLARDLFRAELERARVRGADAGAAEPVALGRDGRRGRVDAEAAGGELVVLGA